jgi:hypothetical protein
MLECTPLGMVEEPVSDFERTLAARARLRVPLPIGLRRPCFISEQPNSLLSGSTGQPQSSVSPKLQPIHLTGSGRDASFENRMQPF